MNHQRHDGPPIRIGSNRQLLVDHHLIDSVKRASLILHQPRPCNRAIPMDRPWESGNVHYMVAFRDDDRFRAWYRCDSDRSRTAYAESHDGITWTKPALGICEFGGATDNNLVIDDPMVTNVAPFKDLNPDTPRDQRYKAIARHRRDGLYSLASPDGLHWRRLQNDDEPLMTAAEGPFDSHNIAFHDPWTGRYVIYARGCGTQPGKLGHGATREFHVKDSRGSVRWIRRSVSDDFVHWSPLEPIDTGAAPLEQLYTNACVPYERSPGLYLMFPSRFVDARTPTPDWPRKGVSDGIFMSSRDGLHFERTFMEAFLRPGPGPDNWHERSVYIERGVLHTGPREMSMFAMEHLHLPGNCFRRLSLRTDGFVSVRAPYSGGELVTRPLVFAGSELRVNLSTSAVGSLRVEIRDTDNRPLPGFGLRQCLPLFADDIDLPVHWRSGTSVAALADRPVRLRFVLNDADLYAFRFVSA